MIRNLAIFSLVGLAACGVSEDKFAAKYAEAACSKAEECDTLGGMSVEDCTTAMETFVSEFMLTESCEYDSKAAKSCLKEVKSAECATDGEASDDDGTSACAEVCGSGAGDDTGA